MSIVEFTAGSLRFLDAPPRHAPHDGFVWIYLERAEFAATLAEQQAAAQHLGGAALLDVHARDLANEAHPSNFDATSVYDRVIFRRLATAQEASAVAARDAAAGRIDSRAVIPAGSNSDPNAASAASTPALTASAPNATAMIGTAATDSPESASEIMDTRRRPM